MSKTKAPNGPQQANFGSNPPTSHPPDPSAPRSSTSTKAEKPENPDSAEDTTAEEAIKPEDEFPDGGFRAWVVAAGTGCVLFSTMGYCNSFGIFQAYYLFHQLKDETPDNIAWIGSVQAFLMFATGAVAGPLFDRYGAWIIRPAAILYLVAIMTTSLCKAYWQFMLAQGVLTGVSIGLLMIPSMSALTQHFNRRRGAAMGLAMAFSSAGAVVFPVLLSKLLNDTTLSFPWTVRIAGFIMLPLLLLALLTIRSRLPPRRTSFFIPSAFLRSKYALLVASTFFMFMGMFIPLVFLPVYGIRNRVPEVLASYLVAMVNGASIPGRIIPGILGDRFGRFNLLVAAGLATTLLNFVWTTATSTPGIIVFAVFFGFASGAIVSGASIVLTLCPDDLKDIGTYMGQGMAVASLATLIGLPVMGVFLRTYDGFLEISIFGGAMTAVGTVLAVISKTKTKEGIFGRI